VKLPFLTLNAVLMFINAVPSMAQNLDLFDGSTSSNWSRETLLDRGSAEWSISGGKMNFFTGSSPTGDNQVLIKYQNPFSNLQDWSFQIGMNNSSNNSSSNPSPTQLQVFVGNVNNYGSNNGDYFGVTLLSTGWGAEFPGHQYWLPGGITAAASQQGSIKVDYVSSTQTYSLSYFNGGIDPISNLYPWSELHSYSTSSQAGNVNLFVGIQTGVSSANGVAYVDNLVILPEPSALSLLAVGLGGWAMTRRRRS